MSQDPNSYADPTNPPRVTYAVDAKPVAPPSGSIQLGTTVYFGDNSIPCHIIDIPAADALAQGAYNDSTTAVVVEPIDASRAKEVPANPIPYADKPTAGSWSFSKQ